MSAEKILVADDTRTVRHFLVSVLSAEGYSVIQAEDGDQALKLAVSARPTLALLDIQMPIMDGIECCRRLRANPATSAIRIIMVSAQSDLPLVRQAFKAGCDGYLTKPAKRAEIVKKVHDLLGLARAKAGVRTLIGERATRPK